MSGSAILRFPCAFHRSSRRFDKLIEDAIEDLHSQ
jgi:hypothetical protein